MPGFGGLAGLASVYPGQLATQKTQISNDQQELLLKQAQDDQAGKAALGKTFQAMVPGAQPNMPPQQPPQGAPPPQPQMQPGQPSPPAQPPQGAPRPPGPGPGGAPGPQPGMPVGAPAAGRGPMPPQGQPPGGPPQGGGDPLAQLQGRFDLKTAATAIAKANPGIKPEVLVSALTAALPYLNIEAKQQVVELRQQMAQQTLDLRRNALADREDQFREREDRMRSQNEEKKREFDIKEKRLEAKTKVQEDQGWQRLENQKHETERKIAAGDRTATMQQWRAIVDAQHKRAIEIIGAYSINNTLDDKQKKALLDDANKAYNEQLENMRNMKGSSTPTGGTPKADGTKTSDRAGSGPKPLPFEIRQQYDAALKEHPDKRDAMIKKMQDDGYNTDGL